MAFENVGMVELLEGFDLAIQHTFFRLALDGSDVDHLYCYFFPGLVVHATVDDGAEASPDDVLESVGVVLNFFTKVVVAVLRI